MSKLVNKPSTGDTRAAEKAAADKAAADKAAADAVEAKKKREEQAVLDRRASGRASTILAGEGGGLAPVVRKTLLG